MLEILPTENLKQNTPTNFRFQTNYFYLSKSKCNERSLYYMLCFIYVSIFYVLILLFLHIPYLVGNGVLFIGLYRVRGCRQVRDGKPLNELLSLFQCVFDFPFPQQFFTDNTTNATLSASGVKIFPFHLLLYTKMHTDKKARKIAIYAATILLLSHYFTLSVIISTMMICL